jgi:hypothetical protein
MLYLARKTEWLAPTEGQLAIAYRSELLSLFKEMHAVVALHSDLGL